jgi:hypothetical protein
MRFYVRFADDRKFRIDWDCLEVVRGNGTNGPPDTICMRFQRLSKATKTKPAGLEECICALQQNEFEQLFVGIRTAMEGKSQKKR